MLTPWRFGTLFTLTALFALLSQAAAAASNSVTSTASPATAMRGQTTEQITATASVNVSASDYALGMTITANGTTVFSQQISSLTPASNKTITAAFTWPVPASAALGVYNVTVNLTRKNNVLATGKARFTVTSATLVDGACGSANGTVTNVAPSSGLCNSGTASTLTGTGSWTWSCLGANGGKTASCMASPPLTTCETMPGTTTQVGSACLPRSSYPAVLNPQDPVTYGADPTGINDSTAAFQTAVNAGNLYIGTPGTYLINAGIAGRGVWVPSDRVIECAPGVTLLTTLHGSQYVSGIFFLLNVSNVTIAGCDFQGANNAAGPRLLDTRQYNFLVFAQDSDNILVEGNTFANTFANSAVQFYSGSTPGVTNSKIQYNTFSGVPLYAIAVVAGTNDVVQNNLSLDGDIGVEMDNTLQAMGNITLQNNEVRTVNGNCARNPATTVYCAPQVLITGGAAPTGANYSTNIVLNNFCTGNSLQAGLIYNSPPPSGQAAQYANNILGPLCSCSIGAGC